MRLGLVDELDAGSDGSVRSTISEGRSNGECCIVCVRCSCFSASDSSTALTKVSRMASNGAVTEVVSVTTWSAVVGVIVGDLLRFFVAAWLETGAGIFLGIADELLDEVDVSGIATSSPLAMRHLVSSSSSCKKCS